MNVPISACIQFIPFMHIKYTSNMAEWICAQFDYATAPLYICWLKILTANTGRISYLLEVNGRIFSLAKARRIIAALWLLGRPNDESSLWLDILRGAPDAMTGTANWALVWKVVPDDVEEVALLPYFLPVRRELEPSSNISLNPTGQQQFQSTVTVQTTL